MMEANKNVGLFDYTIVENTNNVFQIDCIWCAWHATYKQLEARKREYRFVMPMMPFIRLIFNKQALNIKEQKHWDGGNACCDSRFERSVIGLVDNKKF